MQFSITYILKNMGFDNNDHYITSGRSLAFVLNSLSSTLSLLHIFAFLRSAKYESAQRWIAVYMLYPLVVGWISWAQLMIEDSNLYLDLMVNIYKELVLMSFVMYLLRVIGWENYSFRFEYSRERMILKLQELGFANKSFRCFGTIRLDNRLAVEKFIHKAMVNVIQYGVVVCVCFLVSLILYGKHGFNIYSNTESSRPIAYLVIQICKGISNVMAVSTVAMMSKNVCRITELRFINIEIKSKAVILSIVLLQFQPNLITVLSRTGLLGSLDEYSIKEISLWNTNMLFCFESFIIAIILRWVFPVTDYEKSPSYRESLVKEENLTIF